MNKIRGNTLKGEARFVDAPIKKGTGSMKLIEHIENAHNGNISAFAKSQGVLQSQVYRWFRRDCEWHNGHIWCKITKQVTNGKVKP